MFLLKRIPGGSALLSAKRHIYEACKQCLTSEALLAHYGVNRELRLVCDSSGNEPRTVTSNVMDNVTKRAIAYASRTLSYREKNMHRLNVRLYLLYSELRNLTNSFTDKKLP